MAMKYTFSVFPFLFILLGQCRKEAPIDLVPVPSNDTIVPVIYGLTVLRDGENWESVAKAAYYDKTVKSRVRLTFAHNVTSSIIEHFYISDAPTSIGRYPMERVTKAGQSKNGIPNPFLSVVVDEDQLAGTFFPDTTRSDHFFEVLQFDSVKQIIRGRFQVFLGAVHISNSWTNAPDSVLFTKGEFFLKIQEQ